MASKVGTFYQLTKPGILYGNALNTLAGFLLASGLVHHFSLGLLAATLIGSSLVIASGCVFNNYIDRDIDKRMTRTKKRALVRGVVPPKTALLFGGLLGLAGFGILNIYTNRLTVAIGGLGYFFYIVMYSLWWKRRSSFGTIVGSVSGAVPPVAGYCAVTGNFDVPALLLFLILAFWQMPHFYAIALYRQQDYTAAGIPVLPAIKGADYTKQRIMLYIVAFVAACAALTVFGYTGYIYLVASIGLGTFWFARGLQGLRGGDATKWGRKMFFSSLIVTLGTSALLSVGALLP